MSAIDPYADKDVPWLLRSHAETRGDAVFLAWEPFEDEPREWTFAQFHAEARDLAAALRERGLARGDKLLIHANNSPEFLLAWYACGWIGAVAVTTNARAADDELAYYAEHCGAVAAITQPKFAEAVARSTRFQGISKPRIRCGSGRELVLTVMRRARACAGCTS